MLFQPVFAVFETAIREEFDEAKRDIGEDVTLVQLNITDTSPSPTAPTRAAFSVTEHGPVTITWAGIASLWTACQGYVRLHKRIHEETKAGNPVLEISPGTTAGDGVLYLDLTRKLIALKGPADLGRAVRWTDIPEPEIDSQDKDVDWANRLFLKTVGWIMRHELSHIALKHDERQRTERRSSAYYEREADDNATDKFCAGLKADPDRVLGTKPGEEELRLERRAMAVGFGLLWVAMLEAEIGRTSTEHPPIAERIFDSLDRIGLRDDSIAFEAIYAMTDVLIESHKGGTYQTNRDALNASLVELQGYMSKFRHF